MLPYLLTFNGLDEMNNVHLLRIYENEKKKAYRYAIFNK